MKFVDCSRISYLKGNRGVPTKQQQSSSPKCPICQNGGLVRAQVERAFEYGVGDMRVPTSAPISVLLCDSCGSQIDTPETGRQMEDAGRRAVGMMVGDDFRSFREGLSLSLREMSRMTGIGTATLSRWESGRLRPNRSLDLLMQILRDVRGAAAFAMARAKMPIPKRLEGSGPTDAAHSPDVIRCRHSERTRPFLRADREPMKACPILAPARVA